jgi:hypothetical protein
MSPRNKNEIAKAVEDISPETLGWTVTKSVRIEIRASAEEKEQIQEIAGILGVSVAEYLLSLHRHVYPKLRGR